MAVKSWYKKVKCPVCETKHEVLKHELRLDTSEGVHSVFVCDTCADFFDKSAEVLKKRNTKDADEAGDERADQEEDSSVYRDDDLGV